MRRVIVRKDSYHDSIVLMGVSAALQALDGVAHVTVAMGTELTLERLRALGFGDLLAGATANDLLIAVEVARESSLEGLEERVAEALRPRREAGPRAFAPPDLEAAREAVPGLNLALISVPGQYAAYEAERALRAGLHAMVFSDNVPVEEEVALKRLGRELGLLVMGPDCGTAIVNGAPLGFANVVRRGPVGLVGASGTGLQEVSCLLDRAGIGVSQAIGTGGRDLSAEVEAMTALSALEALAADPSTRVLVVVSKPPAEAVARRVIEALSTVGKPGVVCFMGARPRPAEGSLRFAVTLEDAAALAAEAAGAASRPSDAEDLSDLAGRLRSELGAGQRFVRGFFTGGTLCDEALFVLRDGGLAGVKSNVGPLESRLSDPMTSVGHSLVDLGDDVFTRGRPHPMIDPTSRLERMAAEIDDGEVACWLLDCVLGHGSHADPAGAMAEVIREAKARAEARGGGLAVVASVTGTSGDPQGLDSQVRALVEAGVRVMPSNARAARLVAEVLTHGR